MTVGSKLTRRSWIEQLHRNTVTTAECEATMDRIRAVVSADLLKLPASLCHELANREPQYIQQGAGRGIPFDFGTGKPAGNLSRFKIHDRSEVIPHIEARSSIGRKFCGSRVIRMTSYFKHLQHLVGVAVDDLHCNLARSGLVESPAHCVVQTAPRAFVDVHS